MAYPTAAPMGYQGDPANGYHRATPPTLTLTLALAQSLPLPLPHNFTPQP
jgi:hypothetical protein